MIMIMITIITIITILRRFREQGLASEAVQEHGARSDKCHIYIYIEREREMYIDR